MIGLAGSAWRSFAKSCALIVGTLRFSTGANPTAKATSDGRNSATISATSFSVSSAEVGTGTMPTVTAAKKRIGKEVSLPIRNNNRSPSFSPRSINPPAVRQTASRRSA